MDCLGRRRVWGSWDIGVVDRLMQREINSSAVMLHGDWAMMANRSCFSVDCATVPETVVIERGTASSTIETRRGGADTVDSCRRTFAVHRIGVVKVISLCRLPRLELVQVLCRTLASSIISMSNDVRVAILRISS